MKPMLDGENEPPFFQDSRIFPHGHLLSSSIPFEREKLDDSGRIKSMSLSIHLPQIYERMQNAEWQSRYKNGYFLVLLNQAIQQWLLESAFGQCWTIWEHLFACFTDTWMSKRANRQIGAKEKIAFLLIHFKVRVNLEEAEKTRIEDLVAIRNRLIHFGQFPEKETVYSDARMFIAMTEYICAKALGLFPSNIFKTIEQLEDFLKKQQNPSE